MPTPVGNCAYFMVTAIKQDDTNIVVSLRKCIWAIFDLDSTLIQQETIDEMARKCGKYDVVAKITQEAMEDPNKSFADLLTLRLSALKGLWGNDDWEELFENIKYTDRVEELFATLRAKGIKTGIVSGGFEEMVRNVGKYLGADAVMANQLEYDSQGKITGRVIGRVVDAHQKLNFLLGKCDPDEAMAVGDGSNDILMIKAARLGISFMGKPKVRQSADYCIDTPSFAELIALLNKI